MKEKLNAEKNRIETIKRSLLENGMMSSKHKRKIQAEIVRINRAIRVAE